jgi:hypothetical protein
VTRAGRLVAVITMLLGVCSFSSWAHAQEEQQEQQEQQEQTTLRLTSQTSWVRPDGEFAAYVRVAGDTAGLDLRVDVHDRLVTRSAFRLTLEGEARSTTASSPARPSA